MTTRFESPSDAAAAFATWARRTGWADATQDLYIAKVAAFLAFVTDGGAEYAEALEDEHVRDYAVRDFRRMLMVERKLSQSGVEGYMSAIAAFYGDYLNLGRPRLKRSAPKKLRPKHLERDELRKVMRAFERRGPRDFAIASLLFQTAVRVGECASLDTDDVWVGERAGRLDVRHGKGAESRQVPVPADARDALRTWLAVRKAMGAPEVGALWISRRGGGRLSKRRLQSICADVSAETGVDLTAHVFRHTFSRYFLDEGGDVGTLQGILGHRNLSSTQVYTGTSHDASAVMSERVRIDL